MREDSCIGLICAFGENVATAVCNLVCGILFKINIKVLDLLAVDRSIVRACDICACKNEENVALFKCIDDNITVVKLTGELVRAGSVDSDVVPEILSPDFLSADTLSPESVTFIGLSEG